jgi:hypothetical protein
VVLLEIFTTEGVGTEVVRTASAKRRSSRRGCAPRLSRRAGTDRVRVDERES